MKPRILIFSIAYEPLLGGAETAVRNLTDRLSSYEFDLITCRFSRKHRVSERIGTVNVYRVGFGSRLGRLLYPVLAFRLAARLHRKHPYQVVWSIMAAYAGAAALMFLRRFSQVKFLLTLQEGDPIEYIHRQVRGFRTQWQRIFKRANYVQAISQYLAKWARKEGTNCPIEVIPNGVELKKFQIPKSKFQINSKIQISKIVTVSRLVPKNGIDILIKAFAVIARNEETKQSQGEIATHPSGARNDIGIKLQILGTGPEEKKLKKLAKALNVEDAVEFLGNVPADKVPEYLTQADIFVRPSRSEGLGTAFLEAMAAGLPVIGTPVGGIGEFLIPYRVFLPSAPLRLRRTDGEGERKRGSANGLFVKPEDPKDLAEKILLLLKNEKLREELGQNGRRLVEEEYSWDLIAQKMAKIFSGLI